MLNYEEFKEEIRKTLISSMGEKYANFSISEMEVNKAGRIKDGFCIVPPKKKKSETVVMPTLYFDDLYREYLNDEELDVILENVSKAMVKGIKEGKHIGKTMDIDKGPDVIIFQVVNTEEYKSLLKDVPHRSFLDLSVIYRWAIDICPEGFSSTIINHELAGKYGLSENDLFELAYVNTRNHFPLKISSMEEIGFNMLVRNGATAKDARRALKKLQKEERAYFISNGCSKLAATALVYNDVFKKLSDELEDDLYVVPLSSAEILVKPVSAGESVESLSESLRKYNKLQFSDEECISDNVYFYDSNMEQLSLVSEVVGEES